MFNRKIIQLKRVEDSNHFLPIKRKQILESGYSIHSTESGTNKSIVLNKPVTNFFGYTPLKRDGFLPKMTQSDGTLYPIITPDLRYDSSESTRISTATARGAGGLTTTNGEKFAPLSLGKHPWSVQGFAASLENQVPTIKTNAKPDLSLTNMKEQ